jgi:hypothetical protein
MLHRAQPCPVHEMVVQSFPAASNQIITRNDWDKFQSQEWGADARHHTSP